MAICEVSETVMPATIDSVRQEFTNGLPNSVSAAKAWSKCSGWVFMVNKVNQLLSASLMVRPGRCS